MATSSDKENEIIRHFANFGVKLQRAEASQALALTDGIV